MVGIAHERNKELVMEEEQRRAAKRQMIALMQAGHSWQEAAAMAGVRIGRSAAYQLLRNVHVRGEAALQDGRHGHPVKLRQPVREWLETTCREAPQTPSHVVQAALQERFGILISIGHLNRVRAELGLGSRAGHREKNFRSLAR
jgi:transposase